MCAGVDKENLTSTSFGQARLEGTFSRKLSWSLSERDNRTSEQALYFLPRGPAKNHTDSGWILDATTKWN